MKRLFVAALTSLALLGLGCTPTVPEPPAKIPPPTPPENIPLPTPVQPLRDLPDEKTITE